MNEEQFSQLDNPAWWALNTAQEGFAMGNAAVRRYQYNILPFAAYDYTTRNIHTLNTWLGIGQVFYLIGELPSLPDEWTLLKELPCAQMINQQMVELPVTNTSISTLGAEHRMQMFELINKVQPGYYELDTYQLGNYYGIWDNTKLVAIAGERMRLNTMTEISAICTDPDYTGRKYAQRLTAHLCNTNLEKGNIPFLHVLLTNERAINIYKKLGFVQRREISFWQLRKDNK